MNFQIFKMEIYDSRDMTFDTTFISFSLQHIISRNIIFSFEWIKIKKFYII